MGILCIIAACLLALSGINDTGTFLKETSKTFAMFQKPSDKKKSESNSDGDKKSNSSNEVTASEVTSEDCGSFSSKMVSADSSDKSVEVSNVSSTENSSKSDSSDSVENNKSVPVSEKINSLSDKYNKNVLSRLSFPIQLQKNLGALIKTLAEFFGAGYIVCGQEPKGTPFQWFNTLNGKPDEKLLGLKKQ